MKTVKATIDLKALDYNMAYIAQKAKGAKIVAVVKANAYGHGAVACAKVMQKYVTAFAVAHLEEGIELRKAGFTQDIIMLGGFFCPSELPAIQQYDIAVAVHNLWQIDAINNFAPTKPLKVWCQVNIGMQRLGFNEDEVDKALSLMNDNPYMQQPIGMISHLSCADDPNTLEEHQKQLACWQRMSAKVHGPLNLANSAAIMLHDLHSEYVRPGIIQYGVSPNNVMTGADLGLKPVMTLSTYIRDIRKVMPGDVVGYGASWQCTKPTYIGILAAGYADGYPRAMPNGSPVIVNGRVVHTVGHVCMDMMFVDLGEDCQDKIGDEAILWGAQLPVEKIASLVNTIAYELVCAPTARVEYVYQD